MEKLVFQVPSVVCELTKRLRQEGHACFLVGGSVRDCLMGRKVHDWDLATSAKPEEMKKIFGEAYVDVGSEFGVSGVKVEGGLIEFGSFRKDGVSHDHRHPEKVTYGTLEEDAQRRDFTIHALYMDPENPSIILDQVGGIEDLNKKLLRSVGSPQLRFEEDYLRALRALRFSSVLNFEIAADMKQALHDFKGKIVSQVHMGKLSKERVFRELERMFAESKSSGVAWKLLCEYGYEAVLFPGIRGKIEPEDQERLLNCQSDIVLWTLLCHLLGDDFEKHMVLSRQKKKIIHALLSKWEIMENYETLRKGEQYNLWLIPEEEWVVELLNLMHIKNFQADRAYVKNTESLQVPLISGAHLLSWGVQDPMRLKSLLREVRMQQLEGNLKSLHEAQAFVESQ